ncbi:energy transducer TonB [Microbulbifer mangrovi]|uniref:energy transducer TonB n=1 Tax=Microbulbifer mangrovi TaxID=927787 RepID=UPI00099043A9|nr:energy transducer TonB [Microbulbifer mangrovi]
MEQAYPLNSSPLISVPSKTLTLARNGAFALGITGLLLFGMTQLIATDYRAPPEELPPKVASIHLPKLVPSVEQSQPILKPQDPPPVMEPTKIEQSVEPGDIPLGFEPPAPTQRKFDPSLVSADPLPIYKPAPRYPRRALARGIEGHVVVEFTITPSGSVKNPRVVGGYTAAGEPTDVFNREALNAVERFKYRPTISDGQPVERHNVRNRITFRLAE